MAKELSPWRFEHGNLESLAAIIDLVVCLGTHWEGVVGDGGEERDKMGALGPGWWVVQPHKPSTSVPASVCFSQFLS